MIIAIMSIQLHSSSLCKDDPLGWELDMRHSTVPPRPDANAYVARIYAFSETRLLANLVNPGSYWVVFIAYSKM